MTNLTQFLCGPFSSKEQALSYRKQVKAALLTAENMWIVPSRGYVPVCPYCKTRTPTDMHEGLVKKGDVQGWPELDRFLINHPINCVILCHECHMEHGQTSYMTEWFIEHKLKAGWTMDDMALWIARLPFKIQTSRIAYVRKHQQAPEQDMAEGTAASSK